MGILPRYILAEVTKVFLIALVALTLMMVVVGLVQEATQQGLPLVQTLRLVPYILPDTLRMTVPVTLLLACTSVFSRMSGANEVVAVKALGISPMVLLWPVLIMAFLLSLLAVWLNDLAVSWGRNNVQRVVVEGAEEIIYSMLRAQHRYSSSLFSINVKRVDGRRLVSPTVTLQDRGSSAQNQTTITADEAELHSDLAAGVLKLFLRNSTIDVGGRLRSTFSGVREAEIPLCDASRARNSGGLPSCLSLGAIPREIAAQQTVIERQEQLMASQAACQMFSGDFDALAGNEWNVYAARQSDNVGRLYRLMTEPPRRWSAGFSCLCFVWVGAPMAIRLRNRDFLTSFFLCFLPILVVYYPLLAYGIDGAKNGSIPPYCVWAGNLLLLPWGTWLLWKVMRY
jgi:lipopolysaccharide export system permease protein